MYKVYANTIQNLDKSNLEIVPRRDQQFPRNCPVAAGSSPTNKLTTSRESYGSNGHVEVGSKETVTKPNRCHSIEANNGCQRQTDIARKFHRQHAEAMNASLSMTIA